MNARGGRLSEVAERLQADGLMPPVKGVESAAGGVIRVTVIDKVEPDVHARLTAAMGSTRWKLVEATDDSAAGVELRSQGDLE